MVRLGFILEGFTVPAWVYHAISEALSLPFVKPVAVFLNEGINQPSCLSQRVYAKWMAKTAPQGSQNALYPVYLKTLLASVPTLSLMPRKTKLSDWVEGIDLERITALDLDTIFYVGHRLLRGRLLETPRYGVWSYHHGDPEKYRGSPVAFWEKYYGEQEIGVILQRLSETVDGGRILRRSSIPCLRAVAETRHAILWQGVPLLKQALSHIGEEGERPQVLGKMYKMPGLLKIALRRIKER